MTNQLQNLKFEDNKSLKSISKRYFKSDWHELQIVENMFIESYSKDIHSLFLCQLGKEKGLHNF